MEQAYQWEIGTFRVGDSDPDELLALYPKKQLNGENSQIEYFNWYCRDNPAGKALVPIARDPATGQIIGENWMIPLRARVAGCDRLGSSWVNVIVHPDYRRKQVFKSLADSFDDLMKLQGIDFGICYPNETSAKATPKVKLLPVGMQDLMILPLDWSFIRLLPIGKHRLIAEPFIRSANLVWPVLVRPKPIRSDTARLQVEQIAHFDQDFDEFWERVKDKYPIMFVRDSAFLNWRFIQHPTRAYQVLAAREAGELIGYSVCRATTFRKFSAGFIVDLLVEHSDRGRLAGELLVAESRKFLQAQQVDLLLAMMRPQFHEGQILRRQGFVTCPKQLHPIPLNLHRSYLANQIPAEVVSDIDSWYLQLGDFDYV